MFDTTLLVVTRLTCDHYMGTSSKDEMYSLIYKSNLSLQTQLCHIIELVIACTYYEIIIYVREKQHITLLIYKSTICTSSTYHVWRQIST